MRVSQKANGIVRGMSGYGTSACGGKADIDQPAAMSASRHHIVIEIRHDPERAADHAGYTPGRNGLDSRQRGSGAHARNGGDPAVD